MLDGALDYLSGRMLLSFWVLAKFKRFGVIMAGLYFFLSVCRIIDRVYTSDWPGSTYDESYWLRLLV